MAKRFQEFTRIMKQSIPFLLLSSIGELIAGIILRGYLDYINLVPGVFVLLPALMNLRGAVSSMFAARLGSAYHLGLIRRDKLFSGITKEGLQGSLVLAILCSVVSAFFAYFVCIAAGLEHMTLLFFVFLAVVSGLISALILGVLTVLIVNYSIKSRLDPDNVTIPVITTIGDIMSVFLVYALMVAFVGVLG